MGIRGAGIILGEGGSQAELDLCDVGEGRKDEKRQALLGEATIGLRAGWWFYSVASDQSFAVGIPTTSGSETKRTPLEIK